jgi:hypothetical protein
MPSLRLNASTKSLWIGSRSLQFLSKFNLDRLPRGVLLIHQRAIRGAARVSYACFLTVDCAGTGAISG